MLNFHLHVEFERQSRPKYLFKYCLIPALIFNIKSKKLKQWLADIFIPLLCTSSDTLTNVASGFSQFHGLKCPIKDMMH